jgi:SAM-dependent methyltransferase/uncharacterized protein YbaR (Trm112 family)
MMRQSHIQNSRAPCQTLDNLKGEIAFRAKLARQHTTGEMLLEHYYSKADHDKILRERIHTTGKSFAALASSGVDFSRFVELGAERAHRSLVLASRFGCKGIAMDISFHQLETAAHFARLFGLPAMPLRVCCDANVLPLRPHAVPFVFCYQFLHHFPVLGGILWEIERVLPPGGTFFFDEEPFGRLLQARLYRQRAKEYSASNLRKSKLIRWLEGFVSDPDSDEIEHGIIENHEIRLPDWARELSRFPQTDIRVRTLRHLRSRLSSSLRPANWMNHLLGGVISGRCAKAGALPAPTEPETWLACPACLKCAAPSTGVPALESGENRLVCPRCSASYPVVEDIPILIVEPLRKELYPAFG